MSATNILLIEPKISDACFFRFEELIVSDNLNENGQLIGLIGHSASTWKRKLEIVNESTSQKKGNILLSELGLTKPPICDQSFVHGTDNINN